MNTVGHEPVARGDSLPRFRWSMVTDVGGAPVFDNYFSISRSLCSDVARQHQLPFGDQPCEVARLSPEAEPRVIRNAYALSALRFRDSALKDSADEEDDAWKLFPALAIVKRAETNDVADVESALNAQCREDFKRQLQAIQAQCAKRFHEELAPRMNANPFDPQLHTEELGSDLTNDLRAFVALENHPSFYFSILQDIERDGARLRFRYANTLALSPEKSLIYVMMSWCDPGGHRRKKPIIMPTGIPIDFMQRIRRKDQPYICREFEGHPHGALTHWLQEHVWQRFCVRFPDHVRMQPSVFFRALGKVHSAFADSLYELHFPHLINPANAMCWRLFQRYLPFLNPWS